MTNKIKILPENIANKIAAGEVVQRPESVVKELVENSIDADATEIIIVIKNAGKSLIQVIDNGSGMTEEDAVISLQRHATSKITKINDLDAIYTFGFRGEALSSITSVCKFEMKTKIESEELGVLIRFEDDKLISKEKLSTPTGTSISIKNLFYNIPARRKFLKSNATELKHIVESFKRIAISNPQIAFKFYNDDDLIYDLPSENIEKRLQKIFADNILDAVIEVYEPTEFITLKGYVSKPTFMKKNRGDQYLFVNKRYVQSRVINHAIFSAYENIIVKGEYPFFILFIDIDAKKFDINIHPQKLEIKFDDEQSIYSIVNSVIKKGLAKYDFVPTMNFQQTENSDEKLSFNKYVANIKNDFSDRPRFSQKDLSLNNTNINSSKFNNSNTKLFKDDEIDLIFNSINSDIKSKAPDNPVENPFERTSREVYHQTQTFTTDAGKTESEFTSSFIVLLHNKYILSQIKSGLMIIDAHVAHERILYEKALKSFEANMPFSQQLLFSQKFNVDPGDFLLFKELEDYLVKLGFALKFQGNKTIIITGVPEDVKIGSEAETLLEIIEEYKNNQIEKGLEQRDNLAKSYSCKAAIKAGDQLTEKEMRLLVDQLFATSMPYVCPHGRPIVIKIPLTEFDKRFGRT